MALPTLGHTLYIDQEGSEHRGQARLLDVTETDLFIDVPMVPGTSILLSLDESTPVRVSYYPTGKGAMFYFDASVWGHDRLQQLACLRLLRPKASDIIKLQRRAFARVEVPIDISILCVRENEIPKLVTAQATTKDISGGGLSFFCKRGLALNRLDHVAVKFSILDEARQSHAISAKGEITRIVHEDNGRTLYSMKFLQIPPSGQQRVIKYVFGVQLRERAFRD